MKTLIKSKDFADYYFDLINEYREDNETFSALIENKYRVHTDLKKEKLFKIKFR